MTEELPCGCQAETWIPRLGAPTAPEGEQRISVVNLACDLHRHLLPTAEEEAK